jgi:hypothetical protein
MRHEPPGLDLCARQFRQRHGSRPQRSLRRHFTPAGHSPVLGSALLAMGSQNRGYDHDVRRGNPPRAPPLLDAVSPPGSSVTRRGWRPPSPSSTTRRGADAWAESTTRRSTRPSPPGGASNGPQPPAVLGKADQAPTHPRRPPQRIRTSRVEAQVKTHGRVLEPHRSSATSACRRSPIRAHDFANRLPGRRTVHTAAAGCGRACATTACPPGAGRGTGRPPPIPLLPPRIHRHHALQLHHRTVRVPD